MTQEMMIMAAILVAVILITFIGILSRYRKCKSDEVLVVYGKTGGEKKSAKLYHGGAAFVWPIIQGYEFLSMKPMQIGRASCRERVQISVVAVSLKKKTLSVFHSPAL